MQKEECFLDTTTVSGLFTGVGVDPAGLFPPFRNHRPLHRPIRNLDLSDRSDRCDRRRGRPSSPWLKGSVGEGPNHSNFSDRSSVRILGIQRKPRKAPSRKKPLQRSSIRPKIQEGAARKERKGKQTALRERGVRRSRTGAKFFQNSGIFGRNY